MGWKQFALSIFVEVAGCALIVLGLVTKAIELPQIFNFFLGLQGIVFAAITVDVWRDRRRRRRLPEEYNYED